MIENIIIKFVNIIIIKNHALRGFIVLGKKIILIN